MTAPVVVAQLGLGNKQTTALRVALTDGGHVLDLRYCQPISSTSGVMAPTGRGVAVAIDHIPALILALQEAQAKAAELDLLGGGA